MSWIVKRTDTFLRFLKPHRHNTQLFAALDKKILFIIFFIFIIAVTSCTKAETKSLDTITAETQQITEATVVGETKEFTVSAIRFGYSPSTITVKEGDHVKITIENKDFTHGMRFPDLGVAGDNVVEFTATEAGTFTWYCNNFCGEGHGSMSGTLIVEES